MEKHQAKAAAHEPVHKTEEVESAPTTQAAFHRHYSSAEDRRERALHLAFAHMKGAHYDEVINAARAAEKYLKGE